MRKFLLLIYLLVGLGYLNATKAQTTPSSAAWALTDTTGGKTGTGKSSVTTGQVISGYESLKGSNINGYTALNASQRTRITTGNWPALQKTQIDSVYLQFAVSPKPGNIFNVDSVALSVCGNSSNNMKANIYYSTDPTFTTKSIINYSTGLARNQLGTATQFRVKASSLNVNVNPGQTFYVRVYFWNDSAAAASGKYLGLQNIVIGGSTISLPVSSNIIWSYNPSTTFTTTGPLVGQAGSYSVAMKYYGVSNKGDLYLNGTTTAYRAGTIYPRINKWTAAPSPIDSMYFQYAVSPKSGGTLKVDSVFMYIGSWYSSNIKATISYSQDPTFATKTELFTDFPLLGNKVQPIAAKLGTSEVVNSGSTFYLRVYPHNTATEGSYKLVAVDSVKVIGSVTGVTSDPPTITNAKVSYISTTFASTGGNVSSDGGALVSTKGVCWATSANPTIADSKTIDGNGSGAFTSKITGLTSGTLYHMRAYAINSAGTSYGGDSTFTTLAAIVVPTVTKTATSGIMVKWANAGGNATAWGGDTIKAKGVCWNTTGNPKITDSKTVNGNDLGSFTSIMYPLVKNTKYYFCAYATNSAGTGYSVVDSFVTQSPSPNITKVVAKDGTGDYITIQAAFDAVTDNYTGKWIIKVKPGTYKEKVTLASTKVNVILVGVHPDSTILTYDAYAGQSNGAGSTWGTNGSYSVAIDANDFTALNITFQNTIKNDGTHSGGEQAVALRTKGDRQQYYNCKLKGYQDTYYTNSNGRIYMKKCYIEGSVDFIFGNGVMVLDSCETYCNREGGVVTAPNTDVSSLFGYVFLNSKLSSLASGALGFDNKAMVSFYLGRPWQNSPRSAYLNCDEPSTLNSAGWTLMTSGLNPYFAEYKCTGAGSSYASRSTNVDYKGRQLADLEAANYTISNIFAKTTSPSYAFDWMPDNMASNKINQKISFEDIVAKKYGDKAFLLNASANSNITVSFTSSNTNIATIKGDSVIIKGAGTANIKAYLAGSDIYNSALDSVRVLTVAKADLTAKADDMAKKHGEPNPAFTITYTGFVNGDTKTSITEPVVSSAADASSAVGTYPITLSGGTATNYNIILSATNGTLTITTGTAVNALKATEIQVYPNPASNVIKVKRASSKLEIFSIFDMNGSKIIEKKLVSDLEDVDISNFPKGTYMIRLEGTMYKLVVQ